MKTQIAIVCTVLILAFSSCNSKTAGNIVNQSPDKNVTVTIVAKRPTVVDAWTVTIKVKAYSFDEGKLTFEVYDDDINAQNVKFDWQDNNNCIITVPQRDDKDRRFQLIANKDQVQVAEI